MLSLLSFRRASRAGAYVGIRFCGSSASEERQVRVRFAPSPTGDLHLGSLRTVLFNYAFAKKHNGTFILRIEDTDKKRSVEGAVERMLDILRWADIAPVEGPGVGGDYGPYVQSERTPLYRKFTDQLVSSGNAYPCFCSAELLAEKREHALANRMESHYDGTCRNLGEAERAERVAGGDSHTVRLKVPADFTAEFDDLVCGKFSFSSQTTHDQVILKADGVPTYHLANVVDDHHMKISHVIRGKEWVSSTGLHLFLYKCFDWMPPTFLHLPLVMGEDGRKLSKRDADSFVSYFRNAGYHPGPLLAFVSGLEFYRDASDDKLFTLKEILDNFSLECPSDIRLVHDCLPLFEFHHIRHALASASAYRDQIVEEFRVQVRSALSSRAESREIRAERWSDEYLLGALKELSIRHELLKTCAEAGLFFMVPPRLAEKHVNHAAFQSFDATSWNAVCDALETLDDWTAKQIYPCLKRVQKKFKIPMNQFLPAMRLCLMGTESGCGIAPVAELLGKSSTVSRLRDCGKHIQFGS